MLCETSKPFDSEDFIYEKKLDGERILFFIDRKQNYFRIQNRRLYDITKNYPEFYLVERFNFLKENVESIILDGEMCLNDGKSADYHNPQFKKRTHIKSSIKSNFLSRITPLTYYVFDILFVNGQDLRNMPLLERKKVLRDAIKETERVKILEWKTANGIAYYETLLNNGFEGVVAKRWDSKYENKRSSNWLKIKPEKEVVCVVLGWNEKSGRSSYGSIKTDKGDVGLLTMKHKEEYDELVKKFGLGNFKVKARCQEILPSGKMRFPIFKEWVI
jgi:ATP-dependent DNA ligase